MNSKLQSLKTKYDNYVRNNADNVAIAEAVARTFSFFLSGKFKGSHLLAEFINAATGLTSIYNDQVLFKHTESLGQMNMSNGSIYASYWVQKSSVYRQLSLTLTSLSTVQVLLEMICIRMVGNKKKWRFIFIVELVKFCLRFWLFKVTSNRMVVKPLLPEMKREINPMQLAAKLDSSNNSRSPNRNNSTENTTNNEEQRSWQGNRSGVTFPSVNFVSNNITYSGEDSSPSLQFLERTAIRTSLPPKQFLSGLEEESPRYMAELIYMIRPLIYVAAILRFGKNSWKAWLISITMDIAVYQLIQKHWSGLLPTEKEEYSLRKFNILYNLLRSPFYEVVTRKLFKSIISTYGWIPLISIATNALKDQMDLWEEIYFTTSP